MTIKIDASTPLSDPARDLADLCVHLCKPSNQRGDDYLANRFGVPAWSAEYYGIIFHIQKRADQLIEIIAAIDQDEDIRDQAVQHVQVIKGAFTRERLSAPWDNGGGGMSQLRPEHSTPVKMLSSEVRKLNSYPRLNEAELEALLAQVEEFIGWLKNHQIDEQDFIRQALIEGLESFHLRATKLRWVGWGYPLESLERVIGAYLILERGYPDPNQYPNAAAALHKLSEIAKKAYDMIGVAKGFVETGDFLLRLYGARALLGDFTKVVGLLTSDVSTAS